MKPQPTNDTIMKVFSIEQVITALIFIFVCGGSWYSLAGDVKKNTDGLALVQKQQDQTARDLSTVKQDISGIKASQSNQERTMERVLDILERRRGDMVQ